MGEYLPMPMSRYKSFLFSFLSLMFFFRFRHDPQGHGDVETERRDSEDREPKIDVTVDGVRLGDRIAAVPSVLPWLLPTIDLFSDTATGCEFLIRSTCHTPLLRDARVGRGKEVLSFSPP